jgi:hypothetical protein
MLPDLEFWRYLSVKIGEMRTDKENRMLRGLCPDHADYRYQAGYLRALDDVDIAAEELGKAMNEPRKRQA